MRIQHNILAMNAYRNYNNNTNALSKNLEKLSSGYKINRAGDDAAGLAISEKMRAQITGLQAAQKNVKDGTSLVKTAEGAMQEIHDMLNRMDYLATQSANGTYDNEVDRLNLQKEVNSLKSEINRIADSANFNGIKLLDGSLDANAKTSDMDLAKLLGAAGETLGTDTVLHKDAGSIPDTTFSVDLHNVKFPNTKGEDLEIKFGENTITIAGGSAVSETTATQSIDKAKATMKIGNMEMDVSGAKDLTDKKAVAQEWVKQYNATKGAEFGYTAKLQNNGADAYKVAFEANTAGVVTKDPFGGDIDVANDSTDAVSDGLVATATQAGAEATFKKTVSGTTLADHATDNTKLNKATNAEAKSKALKDANGQVIDFTADTTNVKIADLDGKTLTWDVKTASGASLGTLSITFTTDPAADTKDGKTVILKPKSDTAQDLATQTTVKSDICSALSQQLDQLNRNNLASGKSFVAFRGGTTGYDPTKGPDDNAPTVSSAITFNNDGTVSIGAGKINGTSLEAVAAKKAVYTSDEMDFDTNLTKPSMELMGNPYDVTGSTQKEQLEDLVKQFNAADDANNNGWTAKVNDAGDGVVLTHKGDVAIPDGMKAAENEGWSTSQIIAAIEGGQAKLNGADLDTAALKESEITGGNGEKGKFSIEVDKNAGTITFTQLGSDKTNVTGNMEVRVKVGDTEVSKGEYGDYNWSTTKVTNRGEELSNRLASTKFKLTAEMASDNSSITIGKEKYTFTTDESKKGAENTVYVGDLDLSGEDGLKEAAVRLTGAAKGNTTYTVGNGGADPTEITVTEVEGQKDFDLSKMEGIKESLGISIVSPGTGKSLTLQIGDTSDAFNQLSVSVGDMHTGALGIDDLDIGTQEGAKAAIDVIKNAINYVSGVRGDLGAIQNRLEHTQNNLSVMAENIQDAESTIRDTDVAEEMMAYTKNNILIQSAQAMLAQANQVPQGVLQLLG